MLLLTKGTAHLLRVTTDASGDIEVNVDYVVKEPGTGGFQYDYTGAGEPFASITGAGTTTLVAGVASKEVAVDRVSLYNNHASTVVTCTVFVEDGTDTVTIAKCAVAAGELLYMNSVGDWIHLDANGGAYVAVGPVATQAEMEAGAILTAVTTPGRQHFHPSAEKCWGEFTANSTTILASYNITSIANTGTGVMTVTIATDFSSANWACHVTRSEDDVTLVYSSTYDAKAAGSVILRSAVEAGSGSNPTAGSGNASWSFSGRGDL
jgi:hypothetical protein